MLLPLSNIAQYTYNYTTTPPDSSAGANAFVIALYAVALVMIIAGLWKTFQKAGKPGWAAIIPFYSQWVMAEVSGNPGWYGLLLFIPLVNIVFSIIIALGVARNFSKGVAFALIGLWIFPEIGYLILGFGSAKYQPESNGRQNPGAA